MSPRLMDSPRLQRTHSAVQRSESSHSGGLPARSGSYRYPESSRLREDPSQAYARDDSYLYGAPVLPRGGYSRGSGSDKEYVYGSHSETYTTPVIQDTYTPQPLHSRENSFHDSVHSHEGSLQDHHERLYSPVSVQSSHSSNNRQEELYSPVLNMSRQEQDPNRFSPINVGTPTPTRELQQPERMYSPVIPSARDDQCLAFSQDILCQQQGGHASPSPSKPKLRFPRTNPTYIGVNKRDGNTAYKKINSDQQSFSDSGASDGQPSSTSAMQTSQIHPEYFESNYSRPERSDSEASYSSSRAYRMERKDSHTSHSSPRLRDRDRDLSDSQSSQGSIRNMSDVQSEGSLRNMQDSAVSFQDSISSRGSNKSFGAERDVRDRTNDNQFSHMSNNQYLHDTSKDSDDEDSEPEYANILNIPPPSKFEEISDSKVKDFAQIPQFHLNDENNLKNVLKERNSNIEISEYNADLRNGDGSVTLEMLKEVNGSVEDGYEDEDDDQVIDLMHSSLLSEGKCKLKILFYFVSILFKFILVLFLRAPNEINEIVFREIN